MSTRTSSASISAPKLSPLGVALLFATALAVSPSYAGGMMGGGGGYGGGGHGGGGYGGGGYGAGRWEPRHQGRSGYGGLGHWRNCYRFDAASRAAFRAGDYPRGNALQDRFYGCMRSRWID
ncbi:hypothetical protein [Methylosinus sp. RM1]|uniref:hypothetical protein n=1 Tax=Methylosinus sp. RM1 TaxID=2583817 RepID=UPI00140CF321|nr:hypothetical protein [Methylosinus sp. RM1]